VKPTPTISPVLALTVRPSAGIALEHSSLGLLELLKAAYVLVWLHFQRRREIADVNSSSTSHRILVLPVYTRFLKIEAAQCAVWGVFYLGHSYYDVGRVPHLATVIMQVLHAETVVGSATYRTARVRRARVSALASSPRQAHDLWAVLAHARAHVQTERSPCARA
jgi:hypothetical protein